MAKMGFSGIDKLQRDLRRMQQNAKRLDGTHAVPFDKLFTAAFMRKYTRYPTIDALLEAGGFHTATNEDLDAIPENELDAHIARSTKFKSWEAMLEEATNQYIINQMGF